MSHAESRSPARDEAKTFFTNSFLHIAVGSVSGKPVDITESDSFWGFFVSWSPQAWSSLVLRTAI